jgi:hypothetical protein
MMKSLPTLYACFEEARSDPNSCLETGGWPSLRDSATIDLSGGALATGAKRLAVIPLSGVEWSDLDEPGHAFSGAREPRNSPQDRRRKPVRNGG